MAAARRCRKSGSQLDRSGMFLTSRGLASVHLFPVPGVSRMKPILVKLIRVSMLVACQRSILSVDDWPRSPIKCVSCKLSLSSTNCIPSHLSHSAACRFVIAYQLGSNRWAHALDWQQECLLCSDSFHRCSLFLLLASRDRGPRSQGL